MATPYSAQRKKITNSVIYTNQVISRCLEIAGELQCFAGVTINKMGARRRLPLNPQGIGGS
jgi:hypothetical protein